MSYCGTHPTHDSIFGDTYHGVPNPLVPHLHPYPTRFHGPILDVPMATFPYVETPYARVPFAGAPAEAAGACCISCEEGGPCDGGALGAAGDRPPLLSSLTGYTAADALVGAAVGYMIAPNQSERLKWTAVGGVATALLGTLGLVGAVAGSFYSRGSQR
jgi:hypothetical protein